MQDISLKELSKSLQLAIMFTHCPLSVLVRQKKNVCLLSHVEKKLGSVGQKYSFFLILFFITELMLDGI